MIAAGNGLSEARKAATASTAITVWTMGAGPNVSPSLPPHDDERPERRRLPQQPDGSEADVDAAVADCTHEAVMDRDLIPAHPGGREPAGMRREAEGDRGVRAPGREGEPVGHDEAADGSPHPRRTLPDRERGHPPHARPHGEPGAAEVDHHPRPPPFQREAAQVGVHHAAARPERDEQAAVNAAAADDGRPYR